MLCTVRESQGKMTWKSQGKSGNLFTTSSWEPCSMAYGDVSHKLRKYFTGHLVTQKQDFTAKLETAQLSGKKVLKMA